MQGCQAVSCRGPWGPDRSAPGRCPGLCAALHGAPSLLHRGRPGRVSQPAARWSHRGWLPALQSEPVSPGPHGAGGRGQAACPSTLSAGQPGHAAVPRIWERPHKPLEAGRWGPGGHASWTRCLRPHTAQQPRVHGWGLASPAALSASRDAVSAWAACGIWQPQRKCRFARLAAANWLRAAFSWNASRCASPVCVCARAKSCIIWSDALYHSEAASGSLCRLEEHCMDLWSCVASC